jgi:hypothetical protein
MFMLTADPSFESGPEVKTTTDQSKGEHHGTFQVQLRATGIDLTKK